MSMKQYTDIPEDVRERVKERDSYDGAACCICCGSPNNIELDHVVERSLGGMGIEENLACLCSRCHANKKKDKGKILKFEIEYLKEHYPGWDRTKVIYTKWGNQ